MKVLCFCSIMKLLCFCSIMKVLCFSSIMKLLCFCSIMKLLCFCSIMKVLGIEFAPLLIPWQRRLQTAAVLKWTWCFLFLGYSSTFLCIILMFTRSVCSRVCYVFASYSILIVLCIYLMFTRSAQSRFCVFGMISTQILLNSVHKDHRVGLG